MSLSNKVALVTGASSGIGAAIAILFAQEGADVAIVGRNEAKLNNVQKQIEKTGKKPLIIKADVSDDENAKAIVQKTVNRFGKLDILVNNAGFSRNGNILDGTVIQAFDEIMKTNLRAVVVLTSLAAPHLVKTKGNIINISSVGSVLPPIAPSFISYDVSKAALDHFTRGAAVELAASGIRVNSVNPGPVRTDFVENAGMGDHALYDTFGAMTLLGRVSESHEIADLVLFLTSDKAKGITGSIFITDNGTQLKR